MSYLNQITENIKSFRELYFKTFKKLSKSELHTPKLHALSDIPHFIAEFGSPRNWDENRMEAFHKQYAKDPGRRTRSGDGMEKIMLKTIRWVRYLDRHENQQHIDPIEINGEGITLAKDDIHELSIAQLLPEGMAQLNIREHIAKFLISIQREGCECSLSFKKFFKIQAEDGSGSITIRSDRNYKGFPRYDNVEIYYG